jgi:hypothetical protein
MTAKQVMKLAAKMKGVPYVEKHTCPACGSYSEQICTKEECKKSIKADALYLADPQVQIWNKEKLNVRLTSEEMSRRADYQDALRERCAAAVGLPPTRSEDYLDALRESIAKRIASGDVIFL